MVEFTRKEKYIIVGILVAIMEADGFIDPREMDFLNKVISDFGLEEEELSQMDDLDLNFLKDSFREFERDKRKEAVELFIGMAESDEVSDPRELKIIKEMGDDGEE